MFFNKTRLGKPIWPSNQHGGILDSDLTVLTAVWAIETKALGVWKTHLAVGENGSNLNDMFAMGAVQIRHNLS